METKTRRFNIRSFVVMMISLTGLGLPLTGVANHVYGFSAFSLERHIWMSAHNVLGILFTIFTIWHVVLNRRSLAGYLKLTALRSSFISREALLALAVTMSVLFIFIGHAYHAPG